MPKNLMKRSDARELSILERRAMLLDTYGIRESELPDIGVPDPSRKRKGIKDFYVRLAANIFEKTNEAGYTKEFSLAQITLPNIAMAMLYEEDLELNERYVGGELSRLFREDREREELRLNEIGVNVKLNNLYMLRKAAFEAAAGKTLESNVEGTVKAWGNRITFSIQDLLFGTNIPPKITTTMAFLLGVYQADGKLYGHSMSLSGEGDNACSTKDHKGFYESVVHPAVSTLFKINGHSNFRRGRIALESQAHSDWLRLIGYGKKDFPNWKKYVKRKNRLSKDSDLALYDRAFFFGMLAGAARHASERARYPFIVHDSNYSKQFAKLARKFGYQVNENSKRGTVYVNREAVEDMMRVRFELKANGLEFERIGGFYNPVHMKFLCDDYIRMFYIAKPRNS